MACMSKVTCKTFYVTYCRAYCDVIACEFMSSVFSPWNFFLRRKKVKGAQNFTHFTKENTSNGILLVKSATLLALVKELRKLKIHLDRNPVRVTWLSSWFYILLCFFPSHTLIFLFLLAFVTNLLQCFRPHFHTSSFPFWAARRCLFVCLYFISKSCQPLSLYDDEC